MILHICLKCFFVLFSIKIRIDPYLRIFLSDIFYAIRMVFRRLAVDALVFFLPRKKYP